MGQAARPVCKDFLARSVLWTHDPPAYQYFAVDTLGKRQPLEDLAEQLEHLRCVLGFDLSFKSIHLVHVVSLMIPYM